MNRNYTETSKIGKRGVFTIPMVLRKKFGISDGSLVIAEEVDDGILIRPAIATPILRQKDGDISRPAKSLHASEKITNELPAKLEAMVEIYSDERIASFLLSNSADDEEYEAAREEVKEMGLDPDKIDHFTPDDHMKLTEKNRAHIKSSV